jgi:hypothetical protein
MGSDQAQELEADPVCWHTLAFKRRWKTVQPRALYGNHSGRDVSICHFGVLSSWLSRAGLDEILLSYEVEVAYEEM